MEGAQGLTRAKGGPRPARWVQSRWRAGSTEDGSSMGLKSLLSRMRRFPSLTRTTAVDWSTEESRKVKEMVVGTHLW